MNRPVVPEEPRPACRSTMKQRLRYWLAMRRARWALREASDRGGRTWTREDLYERVRTG